MNKGCDNLIFLGLTDQQKSFVRELNDVYNVLEIDEYNDINPFLDGFAAVKNGIVECSIDQYKIGLCQALANSLKLAIGDYNQNLVMPLLPDAAGIVVIEQVEQCDIVMAISYAFAINAAVHLVDALEDKEEKDVLYLIESWDAGDFNALQQLKDKINIRIGGVDFSEYEYATFFTDGLPYTLLVPEIPTSMVNFNHRPDFFVYNAIISEKHQGSGSAAIFSPGFFKDEEVGYLRGILEFENYYLRLMVEGSASVYNLKNTVECYPFDLLHICSHGGEISGTDCLVKFTDRQGDPHTIEFDHVLTVALTPYVDKHMVESLYYFRKFDGLRWRSQALKEMNYTHELYASLLPAISDAFDKKKVINRGPVPMVSNTNAIHCKGFNYTAHFEQFGAPEISPFIFNNTCWSWSEISKNLIVPGARDYIGTLKRINNDIAVDFAKAFYSDVFQSNIIVAFHNATTKLLAETHLPEYIFYGLHFSTLKNVNSAYLNRRMLAGRLFKSLEGWVDKYHNKEGSIEILKSRVLDTKWLIDQVMKGGKAGHIP